MVRIQNTTHKKFFRTSIIFVCVSLLLFFLSTSFAYANPLDVIASGINSMVYTISAGIGGYIAGLGGVLLDMSTDQMVLRMGYWFTKGGIGAVVTSIWTMIRDLFNILFIFSLVYIGLRTILYSDDSGTKKMLGMLIAAALLINFSLYIAKVVVDVSNFTAVQVYETATKGISVEDDTTGYQIIGTFITGDSSISGAYMQVLNISSWFGKHNSLASSGNIFVYSIFMMLFLGFLGFVFAYGALMLVTRFIAIIFYLMFSPLMFLGWVLPQFQSISTKWWKGFIAWCFYAPVYIFMLYVGLYALQQMQGTFPGNFVDGFTEDGGFSVSTMQVFLFYIIGVGFLIGAMRVASIMSQGGAAVGMGAADKLTRRVTTGMGSRAVSGMLGSASDRLGKRMDARNAASGKPRGRTGRAVRNLVGSGATAKFGGSTSRKERMDADKDEKKRHATASAVQNHKTVMALDDSTPANIAKKQQAFADMTDTQLVEIAKTTDGKKLIEDNAQMLSSSQMEALKKSDDVNDADTGSIGKEYSEKMSVHVASNGGVGKASSDQLNALGVDKLAEPANAVNLTEDKIDKLKLVDEHKRTLKTARKEALLSVVHSNTPIGGKSIAELSKMAPSKIAELPDEVFYAPNAAALPHVINFLTGLSFSALEELGRKKGGGVTVQVRAILNSQANAAAATGTYERELSDWLTSDRIGRKFGL